MSDIKSLRPESNTSPAISKHGFVYDHGDQLYQKSRKVMYDTGNAQLESGPSFSCHAVWSVIFRSIWRA